MDNQEILDELDAILAFSVSNVSERKKFIYLLTEEFARIIEPSFKVLHVFNPEESESSHYYYVFRGTSRMTKNKLTTIVSLTNILLGDHPEDNYLLTREIDRLKALECPMPRNRNRKKKKPAIMQPLIKTESDDKGNITEIHLLDCVLLIRLSDHDTPIFYTDAARRRFYARKSIVDNIHYYNIEEAEKDVHLKISNPSPKGAKSMTVRMKGKKLIEHEFREKLEDAGIEKPLIESL